MDWTRTLEGEFGEPLVTIVTPSLNQGRFIRQAIDSVLSQNYSPIEYRVMDGKSTDQTVDVLKSYGDRFQWVSEKDKGQADAINKGWKGARGVYLGWLNSDDVYLPGAVSKAVSFLKNNPEIGAVYGEGYHIEEDGRIIERYPTEPFDRNRLVETCFICQPTVFIRRSILERIGYLDPNLHYCMDYDFWFRIAKHYEMGYIKEYLACTRFYPQTKTLGQKVKVHKEILEMVYRHHRSVPASWVYGYSHAILERYLDRSKPRENSFFVMGLIGLAFANFLYYNHRVPLPELRRWSVWLRPLFQRNSIWKILKGWMRNAPPKS